MFSQAKPRRPSYVEQPEWISTDPDEHVDEYTGKYPKSLLKRNGPFAVVTDTDDTVLIN